MMEIVKHPNMILVLLTALVMVSMPIGAVDKYDLLVNDDNSGLDHLSPRVAVGDGGNFAVIWTDKRNGQSDIYYQFFDSAGTMLGSNRMINNNGTPTQMYEPTVAANISGQFVSVWKDYRNGTYPFHADIYFSIMDTSQALANQNITIELPDSTHESPDIAIFSDGSAVVVWSDYRNRNWDIYGQRLGTDGQLVGKNFKINSETGTYAQHSPRVASFMNGGFVVTWYDNRFGDDDIFAQRFDASFNPIGSNIKISDASGTSRQAFPAIATDGNMRFYIGWVDWRNGTYPQNPDIYFRRFDSSGQGLGAATSVCLSDAGRSQREVSICSDRTGNICVVWADSSNGQWDVYGQIIDYKGTLSGVNFKANYLNTGRQLQPDIDTDGYKFFIVWSDSRSGSFDIYAAIKQYNDPALVAEPSLLNLSMELGGTSPLTQNISLSNAGFGELQWAAVPSVSWMTVAPSSGTTPDTIAVSIIGDSLAFGDHNGFIRIIDLDNDDSTLIVPVKLSVTAPVLEITPDTLSFRVFAALGNPIPNRFQIINAGSGDITWTAFEDASWFDIDMLSGVASDFISVQPDIAGLTYGSYYEPLIITSAEAINSPETAWVHLELVGNMPYLASQPESLVFSGVRGQDFHMTVEVINLGTGMLHWTAAAADDWIDLSHISGSDNDTIRVELETSALSADHYQSYITLTDTTSFNVTATIPVELYFSTTDAIRFSTTNIPLSGNGIMPLSIELVDSIKGAYIPFGYDTAMVTLDSVIVDTLSFPTFVLVSGKTIAAGQVEVGFRVVDSLLNDSTIPAGNYCIANLFFTAKGIIGTTRVDTLHSDSSGVYLLDGYLNKSIPAIIPGELIIGNNTSISEPGDSDFSKKVFLGQNFPNPFNLSTIIEVYLPRPAIVSIEIFNILGQEVYSLHNGLLPAGRTELVWDGCINDSRSAPSGIYFYRLIAGEQTRVRKLVLIK
jgi:hypothetical protein